MATHAHAAQRPPFSPSSPDAGAPRARGSLARTLARAGVRMAFLAVFLFVPAGTLRWPAGWAVFGLWSAYAVAVMAWLLRHDPALLEERLDARPVQENQKGWDKVYMLVSLPAGVALLVLPGLDAVRFGWTAAVPRPLQVLGLAAFVPALALFFLVLRENSFLSRVVKIDKERGHKVITTGPYAVVRHPMYVAAIVFFLAWPLALGSWLTFAPAGLMVVLLILRTWLEDQTLHEELPGYREYAARTRHRLLPGVW